MIMSKMLGSIDPELLKKLAEAIPDVIEGEAKAEETEPPGWWESLRILRSKTCAGDLRLRTTCLKRWENLLPKEMMAADALAAHIV